MSNLRIPIITDTFNHYMPPSKQCPAALRKLPRILTLGRNHPDRPRYATRYDVCAAYYVSDVTAYRWMRKCPVDLMAQVQDDRGLLLYAVPVTWLMDYAAAVRGYPPPSCWTLPRSYGK